jgi:hypothetical protein
MAFMKKSWFLSTFVLGCLFQVAAAQELVEPERVFSEPEGASVTREFPPAQDFFDRMARAEARIAELEARNRELSGESLTEEGGIQQVSFGSNLNLGALLLGHDPEIGIIREQTASGAAENAAAETIKSGSKSEAPKKKSWYDKLSIRGYTQVRLNEEVRREDGSAPLQYVGDRSVGDNQSFLIRRARIIISGDVHERVYVYLQPDFASTPDGSTGSNHFTQIRDFYADFYLDDHKEYRVRAGQSKVPYGWENLQSSSNRLPLDRGDALNSAVQNERDLGVFFYYTPTWAQDLFKEVLESGLKGSGNYGLFAFGVHNGQGGSFSEANDNMHLVTRLAVPYKFCNGQIMEVGVGAYQGEYVVGTSSVLRPGGGTGTPINSADGFKDERVFGTFVWYPQPIGFQTEWTVGRGPGLNEAMTRIEEQHLYGGYAMVNYKLDDFYGTWFPFARWSYYQGGYKSQRNAPVVDIDEWELGAEWQINPAAEFTLSYLITDRTNTSASTSRVPYGQYDGNVIRMQFQFNY